MVDLIAELRILIPAGERPAVQQVLRELEQKVNEIARKTNALIDRYNDSTAP